MLYKGNLWCKGVNCIHHIIQLPCRFKYARDVLLLHVFRNYGKLHLWIYIQQPLCQHLALEFSQSAVKGNKLSVQISLANRIRIYQHHITYTCTAKHLRGIGTYTAKSHNHNFLGCKGIQHLLTQQD